MCYIVCVAKLYLNLNLLSIYIALKIALSLSPKAIFYKMFNVTISVLTVMLNEQFF